MDQRHPANFEQVTLVAPATSVARGLSIMEQAYGVFVQNFTAQWAYVAGGGFMPPNTSGTFPLEGTKVAQATFQAPPGVTQPVAVVGQTCFLTYVDFPLPPNSGPTQSTALASVATLERFAKANIPAAGNVGRAIFLSDDDRNVWLDDGTVFFPVGGEIFNVKAWDARGNGITDDTAAIQNAINAAGAVTATGTFGATVYFPPGNYLCLGALNWLGPSVDLVGAGMFSSTLRFDGAHDGIQGLDAGPSFTNSGRIRDLQIVGQNGALAGINITFRQEVLCERLRVSGFTRQGIFLDHVLMSAIDRCQLGGNGDATRAQVEIDHFTTFHWRHSYISGSNVTTIAGLALDRGGPFSIIGGAVESTGIPLRLAGKAEAAQGVGPGIVHGLDMENPNNGAVTYVELGSGWTGTAGQGVTRVSFLSCAASPSGSATVANGIRAVQSDTIYVAQCSLSLAAGTQFTLVGAGANNLRWSLGVNGGPVAPVIYVTQNAATRPDARPDQPWELIGRQMVYSVTTLALNSTTPAIDGYSYVKTQSAIATAITNITGGKEGQILFILANDGNTTLNNLSGGAGQIALCGGANLALTGGHVYEFIYDEVNARWRQICVANN